MNELKHFGNSFGGPDKDVCQSCGNESSTMYWQDGVCKSCQDGRKKTLEITTPFLMVLAMMMFPLAIIEILLNIATLGI